MAKMICVDCGYVFDDEDAFVVDDTLDYIDGRSYRETLTCCPECNGEYEAAAQCRRCGEWFRWEKLVSGTYCRECMEELLNDVEMLKNFASEDLETFAEYVLEKEEEDA